jgi:N-acetylmuramoyl-L-alanine amidase
MGMLKKRIVVWMTFRGGLKVALSLLVVILLATIFTYDLSTDDTIDPWSLPLSGKIIVLDAGHGGIDGGAEGHGLVEKDITLDIVLYLRDYLQQSGAIVILTREDDRELATREDRKMGQGKRTDLNKRVRLVRDNSADIMVTVHLNSIPSSHWSGSQTFYRSGNENGHKLAQFIQEEMVENLNNTSRSAKPIRDVFLLEQLKIPAALVEGGFLSNPKEAQLLGTEKYQKKIAASIYRGILRYYSGELQSKE